jgi:hypothetical protein
VTDEDTEAAGSSRLNLWWLLTLTLLVPGVIGVVLWKKKYRDKQRLIVDADQVIAIT